MNKFVINSIISQIIDVQLALRHREEKKETFPL